MTNCDRPYCPHRTQPHATDVCSTEATDGAPKPQYDLNAMREARELLIQAHGHANRARRLMKQAGMTPGFGLDVWSSSVVEYAAKSSNQISALIQDEEQRRG